jgi:hypothetical protein
VGLAEVRWLSLLVVQIGDSLHDFAQKPLQAGFLIDALMPDGFNRYPKRFVGQV